MTRRARSRSISSPSMLSVVPATLALPPTARSMARRCSSCRPSRWWKRAWSSKWSWIVPSVALWLCTISKPPSFFRLAGAARARTVARCPAFLLRPLQKLIDSGQRPVQPRGVLPAGLGEVGPAAAPAVHERGDLLQDLSRVVLLHQVLRNRRKEKNLLVARR